MIDESNLPQTINDCVFIGRVGHGGSAQCYLVESKKFQLNKLFVAKVIPSSQFMSITAENNALMELNHPNIIQLYDRFSYLSYYVLILEYCENKSLAEAIVPNVGIHGYKNVIGNQYEQTDLDFFKNCAYQIISALSFCHSKKCAHRDIKPSNVLIGHYGQMKLADFGFAIKYNFDNDLEYEYEYEDDRSNNDEQKCQEDKKPITNQYQIPIMAPLLNDNASNNTQNAFETKIYYFNNIQFKRRKLSSDSEQTRLNHNYFNIPTNEKLLNHRKKQISRTRSLSDNVKIDNRHIIPNSIKPQQHAGKLIKKRKRILCNSFCGSLIYAAPEILLRQSYDPFSADIWSLGVLFIVMLTGCSPWEGKGQEQIQEKILKREISPEVLNKIPSDLIELINRMIVIDPTMRLSIQEVSSSPFFDDPSILSAKNALSSHKYSKLRTVHKKSHSYNSYLTPNSHCGTKLFHKNHSNVMMQSQDKSSSIPNSFAQSPLTPSFKRLYAHHLPKTPALQFSPNFIRKGQQARSPAAISIPYFKKTSSLKSSLPIINPPQQKTEKDTIEMYLNQDDTNHSIDENQLQHKSCFSDGEMEIEDISNQQNAEIDPNQTDSNENEQISPNNDFDDNSSSHISKCQSLHSSDMPHLSFFAKL